MIIRMNPLALLRSSLLRSGPRSRGGEKSPPLYEIFSEPTLIGTYSEEKGKKKGEKRAISLFCLSSFLSSFLL